MKYKFLTFMGNSITTMSQFQVQKQPKAKILKQVMFIFPTSVPHFLSGAFLCFFFFLIIFTFLGLCRVFTAAYRLSQVAESGCYPLVVMHGFLIVVASVVEHRL